MLINYAVFVGYYDVLYVALCYVSAFGVVFCALLCLSVLYSYSVTMCCDVLIVLFLFSDNLWTLARAPCDDATTVSNSLTGGAVAWHMGTHGPTPELSRKQ